MTRRGSLAYYLTAWVCGSLFFILFRLNRIEPYGAGLFVGLFLKYFTTLIFGCVALLVFAFLLRGGAQILRWSESWHWVIGGAGLSLLLGGITYPFACRENGFAGMLCQLPRVFWFREPAYSQGISGGEVFATLFGGLATAYLLSRIHLTFARQEDASK